MKRFYFSDKTVIDARTGLMWTRDGAIFEFPLCWEEALEAIKALNRQNLYGLTDWKLPNRRELFSLISHSRINPSLPADHPFTHIFPGYYWTSTTCVRLPNQAWYIHLGGGRVFKGMKHGSYRVWPVRTADAARTPQVCQTGQTICYDAKGATVSCRETGQDGEWRSGSPHGMDRFVVANGVVRDSATGLQWLQNGDVLEGMMDWRTAFDRIGEMNRRTQSGRSDWRVPNIVELESLIDMGRHSPALPPDHPFEEVQDFYWSSTTSVYHREYAWVLYMKDGAVGVGHKPLSEFYLWPVCGNSLPVADA
ncbi:MAG: DUF1566 domain-containing protein [Desulfosarcinaceae bacterium]